MNQSIAIRSDFAIPAKVHSELFLVEMTRNGDPLDRLQKALIFDPIDQCGRWTASEAIREDIAANETLMAQLPSVAEVTRLAEAVMSVLSVSTERIIKKEIIALLGSYPNARPPDAATYVRMMIFDVFDRRIPDAVLVAACQELRRSLRFPPTIAEVLETCERLQKRWACVEFLRKQIGERHELFSAVVRHAKRLLIEADRRESADEAEFAECRRDAVTADDGDGTKTGGSI